MKVSWLGEVAFMLFLVALVAVCVPDLVERCLAAGDQAPVPVESRPPLSPAGIEAEVIRLANQERVQAGLQPMRADPTLTRIARARSKDMAQRRYFAHRDPETHELLVYPMLAARGLHGGGENLFLTGVHPADAPASAVSWWMDSPSHRANILRADYRRTGVGVAVRGQEIYVTQVFLEKQ